MSEGSSSGVVDSKANFILVESALTVEFLTEESCLVAILWECCIDCIIKMRIVRNLVKFEHVQALLMHLLVAHLVWKIGAREQVSVEQGMHAGFSELDVLLVVKDFEISVE